MMAPAGVGMVSTSLGLSGGYTRERFEELLTHVEPGVRHLVDNQVEAILQVGLPPMVMYGWGFEDKVRAQLAAVTDLPLATDIGSCIKGMQVLGMSNVVMLSPSSFHDGIQEDLVNYVRHAGIKVVAAGRVDATRSEASHLPLSVPYRAAKSLYHSVTSERVDGVWLTGAFQPSVGMIAQLEDDLGVPVISSMQAVMWAGLRLVNIPDKLSGFGRLLETP